MALPPLLAGRNRVQQGSRSAHHSCQGVTIGGDIVNTGQDRPVQAHAHGSRIRVPHLFRELLHRLLALASQGVPRPEFLRQACGALLQFSGCDSVEVRLEEAGKPCRAWAFLDGKGEVNFTADGPGAEGAGGQEAGACTHAIPEHVARAILQGDFAATAPLFTRRGSFFTGDAARPLLLRDKEEGQSRSRTVVLGGAYPSIALIRVPVDKHTAGVLLLGDKRRDFFSKDDILFYEAAAEAIGAALAHQSAQWSLRERVKELTCLYGIAQVARRPDIALPDLLRAVVELLPQGWQYPEITRARIQLDGHTCCTAGFALVVSRQRADIVVNGSTRGSIEVVYAREMPEMDEGPFLKEERSLINEIARQVAVILQQREAVEEKARLQGQLRHADRLATIGQLAAGAAHELNEPLGAILGFAQLAMMQAGLAADTRRDLERIEGASLHAREVVRKLIIFARQMPAKKTLINLNALAQEGLFLAQSRCEKEGIKLVYRLAPEVPDIEADPAQIGQVIVNLVVNAMQATPPGGSITVATRTDDRLVSISVEDTGTGMTAEVMRQMFVPFFTTKGVGQGTGLGLSVVHGIVTAHGGEIKVDSEVGKGSRFEILLPR